VVKRRKISNKERSIRMGMSTKNAKLSKMKRTKSQRGDKKGKRRFYEAPTKLKKSA